MTPSRMAQVSIGLCAAAWLITVTAMLQSPASGYNDVSGPLAAGSYLLIWLFDIGAAVTSFVLTRKAAAEAPLDSLVDVAYLVARVTAGAVGLLTLIILAI